MTGAVESTIFAAVCGFFWGGWPTAICSGLLTAVTFYIISLFD